jgi:hypothetical protein
MDSAHLKRANGPEVPTHRPAQIDQRPRLRRIGTQRRFFVEFGVGEGKQGNCVLLADYYGWEGVFIETDPDAFEQLGRKYQPRQQVQTQQARVTANNIESLLADARVPTVFDVLSIDIDGNDYWVWEAITAFRPHVVVIEYNSNLPLDGQFVMPSDDEHNWDATDYFGASLGAYMQLAGNGGYFLAHTDRTEVNAFFVADSHCDAFRDLPPPATFSANYFRQGLVMPLDPEARPFLNIETGRQVQVERPDARVT